MIWEPQVYLFDTIPNTMNPLEVAVILCGGGLVGGAGGAGAGDAGGRLHPVEALRWE